MNDSKLKDYGFYLSLALAWVSCFFWIPALVGNHGLFGNFFTTHIFLKMGLIFVAMAHLTISAMSIAFHRAHTHKAVKLHPIVDTLMQTWLWCVTSMSKLDWVSVHVYHHTHSDTDKDPHSPSQKGLARVFFLGALDYTNAKNWPEVLKIRARIPANAYESFISRHLFMGPIALSVVLMMLFGPVYGSILSVLNFIISPLFAVGGVNALAHAVGYQNYDSKDESRNIGFLFFLNWIVAGELDHNNHHKFPKSPTFSHRWFEFDIGWVYIRMMKNVGLARVTGNIPNYQKSAKIVQTEPSGLFVGSSA